MMQITLRNVNGMEEIVVERMYLQITVRIVHVLIQEQEILEQQLLDQQLQVIRRMGCKVIIFAWVHANVPKKGE